MRIIGRPGKKHMYHRATRALYTRELRRQYAHRVPIGALCEGSFMRELYAALQGLDLLSGLPVLSERASGSN